MRPSTTHPEVPAMIALIAVLLSSPLAAASSPVPVASPKPVAQSQLPTWTNQAKVYVHLRCMPSETPGRTSRSPVFDDFLVVEKGSLTAAASGTVVRGRSVISRETVTPDDRCRSHYFEAELATDQWGNRTGGYYPDRQFRVARAWNALTLTAEDASVVLSCSASSLLKVYDSKAALLRALSTRLVQEVSAASCRGSQSCGHATVSHAACLIDEL